MTTPAPAAKDLYNKAINEIYNALCPTIYNADGSAAPLTDIFCMKYPTLGFGPTEYDPATTRGREALALLCNSAPQKQKSFVERSKVDFEVRRFLSLTHLPEDRPLTDDEQKKLNEAKAVLAAKWEGYRSAREEYQRAVENYYSLVNLGGKIDEAELNRRSLKMRLAYDQWVISGRREVENALTTRKIYDRATPRRLFAEALDDFEMAARAGTTGSYYHVVKTRPENWSKAAKDPNSNDLAWAKVSLDEKSSSSRVHKTFSSMKTDVSASASGFLWGGSASAGMAEDLEKITKVANAHEMQLSLEVAAVDIDRSWFVAGLMRTPEARMPDLKKGQFSTGAMEADQGYFDLVPTRIVLARNIEVANVFSASELKFIDTHKEAFAKAQVNYCGFSLSGGFSTSERTSDHSAGEGGARCSIKLPGPQVIGFVCSLNPDYPTEDSIKGDSRFLLQLLRLDTATPQLPDIFEPEKLAAERLQTGASSAAPNAAKSVSPSH